MAAIDRFILLVRDLRRSEAGMALPVALFAMISSMALAGAAVVATTDVQLGATRDHSSKSAIAAADAGAAVARARQSRYGFILNSYNPCLAIGTDGKLAKAPAQEVGPVGAKQKWCPSVSGTIGDASYVYQVSPVGEKCGAYELCVVSTGTAGKISRRIEVTFNRSGLANNGTEQIGREEREKLIELEAELKEATWKQEWEKVAVKRTELEKLRAEESKRLGAEGFVGRDGIVLSGNADIRVGLGTNGNLETSGNATICKDIRIGVGKKWTKSGNASQCAGYTVKQGNVSLPPVTGFMPTNIATVNSNARITTCTKTNVPVNCQKDVYTGSWTSKPPFNPGTRAITLTGNESLTVGGGDYWICSISFSGNSELIMAQGARVRFFFDTPEHCGNGNQLSLSGNNRISATGYQPSMGNFEMPGFYFLGSPAGTSQINLSGNFGTVNEMIIYGPDTYINVSGNATFKGIMVGRQISMSGNGKIEQDAGFQAPPELNPGSAEKELKELQILEEKWKKEGLTLEEIQKERIKEQIKRLEAEKTSNRSPIYYTPQAYFECIGAAPTGGAPNANC
jgi:hypothetical protein